MIAELVREAALEGVRDELPHSLAVVVDEIVPREGRSEDKPLLDVRVNLFVERDSQKAIVIGQGGSRLREVGTNARARHRGSCSASRSTSTCTSRSPRTGSATPSSSAASGSEPPDAIRPLRPSSRICAGPGGSSLLSTTTQRVNHGLTSRREE